MHPSATRLEGSSLFDLDHVVATGSWRQDDSGEGEGADEAPETEDHPDEGVLIVGFLQQTREGTLVSASWHYSPLKVIQLWGRRGCKVGRQGRLGLTREASKTKPNMDMTPPQSTRICRKMRTVRARLTRGPCQRRDARSKQGNQLGARMCVPKSGQLCPPRR